MIIFTIIYMSVFICIGAVLWIISGMVMMRFTLFLSSKLQGGFLTSEVELLYRIAALSGPIIMIFPIASIMSSSLMVFTWCKFLNIIDAIGKCIHGNQK